MKKIMLSLGVVAAVALSLVSCQKEMSQPNEPEVKGTPFEIIATSADTKTVNNGLATEWAGNESINLFHAAAGTTTYNNGGEFTTTEAGASAKFNGTLSTELSESNDWYAFYPYNKDIESPANSSKISGKNNFTTIGQTAQNSQTQNGVNDKSHLAGTNLPMYAIVKNIAKAETPALTFKHLTSVIKVHVTNNSGEEISINNVSFTSPEDIVGTYCIDYTTTPISYTKSGDKYVSSTASLNVTDASLADGAAADFYLAIKPFTAKAGSKLTLTVNGQSKDITLENDVTFTAGNIKPLNFNYEKQEASKKLTATFDFTNVDFRTRHDLTTTANISVTDKIFKEGNISLKCVDNVKYYYNGTNLRVYQNASLEFTADEGYIIENISFTGDGTLTQTENTWTYSNSGSVIKFTKIDVTYKETMPRLDTPIVKAEKNASGNGINVSWEKVNNATEYVVSCNNQDNQTLGAETNEATFENLPDGDYVITVTANANGYVSSSAATESIHIGLASRKLAFADETKTIGFNETYQNVLNGEKTDDVTYSITNADGSEVDENAITIDTNTGDVLSGDVAGEYTITATAPATAEYAAGTASYTLTVKDKSAGEDEAKVVYALITSDNKQTSGTSSTYASAKDITINGITWNTKGNLSMTPWRIGGKTAQTGNLETYTKTAYPTSLQKISISFGKLDSKITVNSVKLLHSTNADFSDAREETITFEANSTKEVNTVFPANSYYKFVFNVTINSSSNTYFELIDIKFWN